MLLVFAAVFSKPAVFALKTRETNETGDARSNCRATGLVSAQNYVVLTTTPLLVGYLRGVGPLGRLGGGLSKKASHSPEGVLNHRCKISKRQKKRPKPAIFLPEFSTKAVDSTHPFAAAALLRKDRLGNRIPRVPRRNADTPKAWLFPKGKVLNGFAEVCVKSRSPKARERREVNQVASSNRIVSFRSIELHASPCNRPRLSEKLPR